MTLETRPRIPAAAPPPCPNRTMELNHTSHTNRKRRTRADGVLNHRNVKKTKQKPKQLYITLPNLSRVVQTYRRCQVQLARICGACGPPQICCPIDCLPATWRQHITHDAVVHTGSQVDVVARICIFQQQNRGACLENKWQIRERQTGLYQSGGDETKKEAFSEFMHSSSARSGIVSRRKT